MNVDPRAGVLPYGLNDAAGLPYHAAGLHVVAQNAVTRRHSQRRVLCRRLEVSTSTASSAAVAVVAVVVVVVIAWPCSREGFGIIVLVIVVVPLRSRPLHRCRKKIEKVQGFGDVKFSINYPNQSNPTQAIVVHSYGENEIIIS